MHVMVVGGGILGLAVARALRAGGHDVTVCEKEPGWAAHQTGRNSGVIHSGLYYKPGGLKARLCVAGSASMAAYAGERGLPVEIGGKLVVAVDSRELPALAELERRGTANGVPVRRLDAVAAQEYEPEVRCVAALRVATTGIVDYAAVAHALAAGGAELRPGVEVLGVHADGTGVRLQTSAGELRGDGLVNCAGLHSDRIARLTGLAPAARIVPFRGEYFELTPAAAARVRGLIYPVPDPAFPFLGVHLTRGIDGSVHAGPNAVLALCREGYRWWDVSARDLGEILGYPGFWRLARQHARTGVVELARSVSRRAFAAALSRLVPGITAADLVRASAGVRAQAVGGTAPCSTISWCRRVPGRCTCSTRPPQRPPARSRSPATSPPGSPRWCPDKSAVSVRSSAAHYRCHRARRAPVRSTVSACLYLIGHLGEVGRDSSS